MGSTGATAAAKVRDNTCWSRNLATRQKAQVAEVKVGPMLLNGSSSAATFGDQDGLGAAPIALSFDGAIEPPTFTKMFDRSSARKPCTSKRCRPQQVSNRNTKRSAARDRWAQRSQQALSAHAQVPYMACA